MSTALAVARAHGCRLYLGQSWQLPQFTLQVWRRVWHWVRMSMHTLLHISQVHPIRSHPISRSPTHFLTHAGKTGALEVRSGQRLRPADQAFELGYAVEMLYRQPVQLSGSTSEACYRCESARSSCNQTSRLACRSDTGLYRTVSDLRNRSAGLTKVVNHSNLLLTVLNCYICSCKLQAMRALFAHSICGNFPPKS